eukprot:TRINITY_DN1805_c0_g1_i9.p1 TRINITY_DN1805_c0_g1~~TRINITY_DN1805_c0_g1_i9.p1  ORF type:complete len:196 (-),score=36.17 TRINITY_DN1805_c0_g1_i9:96-683(-)
MKFSSYSSSALAAEQPHNSPHSPELSHSFSVESGTDTQVSGGPIVWLEFMGKDKVLRKSSLNNVRNVEIPRIVRAMSGNVAGHSKRNVGEVKERKNVIGESQKEEMNRIFNADQFKRVGYDVLLDNYKVHEKGGKKSQEYKGGKVIGHFKGFPALIVDNDDSQLIARRKKSKVLVIIKLRKYSEPIEMQEKGIVL